MAAPAASPNPHGFIVADAEVSAALASFTRTDEQVTESQAANLCHLNSVGSHRIALLVDVLLVVVNDLEKASVLAHLAPLPLDKFPQPTNAELAKKFKGDWEKVRYLATPDLDVYMATPSVWIGMYGQHVTAVVQAGQQGMIGRQGVLLTLIPIICGFLPRIVVNVGLMYGGKEEPYSLTTNSQRLGDVIVAERIYNPEWKKIRSDGGEELRGPESTEVGLKILQRFQSAKGEFEASHIHPGYAGIRDGRQRVRVHFGPIVSESVLMSNTDAKTRLFEVYADRGVRLIGGEMEGQGVLLAGALTDVSEFIIVKGICDWGDNNKDDRFQPFAAEMAALYVEEVLDSSELFAAFHPKVKPKTDEARALISRLEQQAEEQRRLVQLQAGNAGAQAAMQLPPSRATGDQVLNAVGMLAQHAATRRLSTCPRCQQNTFLHHAGIRVLTASLTMDFGECQNQICRYDPGAEFRDQVAQGGDPAPAVGPLTTEAAQQLQSRVPTLHAQPEYAELNRNTNMDAAVDAVLSALGHNARASSATAPGV